MTSPNCRQIQEEFNQVYNKNKVQDKENEQLQMENYELKRRLEQYLQKDQIE